MQQLRRFFDWLRESKLRKMDVILIILLGVLYLLFDVFGMNMKLDFNFSTAIDSGAYCILDDYGGNYVIDKGQIRIFKVKNEKVNWEILVDKNKQIELVAIDYDENVYICETSWDDTGWILTSERINKYSANGEYIETIYLINYDEQDRRHRCSISNIRFVDGYLKYLKINKHTVEVCKIVDDSEIIVESEYLFEDAMECIQTSMISVLTKNIYIIDRRGKILYIDEEGIHDYYTFQDDVVLYDLSLGKDDIVNFTDLKSASICKISPQKKCEEVWKLENTAQNQYKNSNCIFRVAIRNVVLQDGSKQELMSFISNEDTLYVVGEDGELISQRGVFEFEAKYLFINIVRLVLSIVFVFVIAILVLRLIFVGLFNKNNLSDFVRNEIIILLNLIFALIVFMPWVLTLISDLYITKESEKLLSISSIISRNIDAEKIRNINRQSDFLSDDYMDVLQQIRIGIFDLDDAELPQLGGIVEKVIDDVAVDAMYSAGRSVIFVPLDIERKETFLQVYETKKSNIVVTDTIIGQQLTASSPICDSNGEVVGCFCVEQNLNKVTDDIYSIFERIVINVLSVVILLVFLINEVIIFLQKRKQYIKAKHVKEQILDEKLVFPDHILRLSNAIFSMSVNISSGFLPIYAISFYSNDLSRAGISTVLAGGIALSINVAFIFLASTLALSLFEKFGFKKVIIFAVCCSIVSDIMLATANSYYMLVFALLINGIGYGLLIESKRSYLSKLPYYELNRVQIFCSSGGDSGKFIGLLIGGFLAITLPYNEVFWMSVLIDIVAFGFCIYFCKTYSASGQHNVDEKSKMSLLPLILSKEVFGYLISMPIILGIIAGFVGYYIPMYGSMNNFYGNEISLSLAVVILCPVFFASTITDTVIKKFGKNSIYIAVLTALTAMILLVNFRQFILFVISLLLLGVAYSFGSGVCRYRFSQINKVKEYGENRAQSTYNSFFAVGNIISSLIFASMLSKNMSLGMWTFAILVIVVMGVYKICFDQKSNAN